MPCNPCRRLELVRQARDGNRYAYDELARYFRPALLAIVFPRTGNRDDAEDLVQEVLAKGWTQIASLRDSRQFSGWLKAIAINACNTWYRKSVQWPSSLDELDDTVPIVDHAPAPLDVLLAKERARAQQQALLSLSPSNRTALLMHIWGEYSYREIAEFTGEPLTTIEGRIYRAKVQMRRLLAEGSSELLNEPARRWRKDD